MLALFLCIAAAPAAAANAVFQPVLRARPDSVVVSGIPVSPCAVAWIAAGCWWMGGGPPPAGGLGPAPWASCAEWLGLSSLPSKSAGRGAGCSLCAPETTKRSHQLSAPETTNYSHRVPLKQQAQQTIVICAPEITNYSHLVPLKQQTTVI